MSSSAGTVGERRPLLPHPMVSVDRERQMALNRRSVWKKLPPGWQVLLSVIFVIFFGAFLFRSEIIPPPQVDYATIDEPKEFLIPLGNDDNVKIWFRTWGNQRGGVPLLFVHGGPGNAVSDYHNGNKRFFNPEKLFVVEVDQRGTGRSEPSVREDYHNMGMYQNISMNVIADDYEAVRTYLNVEQWIVWGGSYGSTIGLNYCMRYPKSCIAMMLRGIYLNTVKELDEVYTQQAFRDDPRKTSDFDLLYQVAQSEVEEARNEPLDPNDARRLLEVYERMIQRGDKQAIWSWYVFENNLMEDVAANRLDPRHIIEKSFPEAQSVAFFETRLWLHETFEKPSHLLDRVEKLQDIPIWICQGKYDNVCPAQNARVLVNALEKYKVPLQAHFLEANHEDTDPLMAACLKSIVDEFLNFHASRTVSCTFGC